MVDWNDKMFEDLWALVTWNSALQVNYTNILVLASIARCQCVSTSTCETAFSMQNVIKTKFRNCLNIKHLESVLMVAIEGHLMILMIFWFLLLSFGKI